MHRLKPAVLFVVALAMLLPTSLVNAAGLKTAAPERVGLSSERLALLPQFLEQYAAEDRIAGGVVLLIKDGRIVLHEAAGYRDREAQAPMEKDSIFRIASQTKAIVSVGVMMLQEQGKLLIGDPVGKYLPEFNETNVAVANGRGGYDVVPASRPITIRDLLTHTAGIDYGWGTAAEEWRAAGIQGWYFGHREEPVRETVRRMASLPMQAHPGEQFVYGYNTDILGALIEVVSGQPLNAFLRERLFEPLDMVDTYFYLPEQKRDRLTVVYSAKADGALQRAPATSAMIGQGAYIDGPRTSFSGGAGLLSSIGDYGRFLQMLANGGELEGARILSRNTVELMTLDHLNGIRFQPGQGFGLGFSVNVDRGARGVPGSLGEYGWGGAYHTTYFVDPVENLVVLYMTQLLPATGLDDTGKIRALIYQSIK